MFHSKWLRTSRAALCPVCKHDSWCMVSADGAEVMCMRALRDGIIAPDSPNIKRVIICGGEAAIIRLSPGVPLRTRQGMRQMPDDRPTLDFARGFDEMFKRAQCDARRDEIRLMLGMADGIPIQSPVGWHSHETIAFPMYGVSWQCNGIRLRRKSGRKFSVTGSKNGLFADILTADNVPSPVDLCIVVEGATDTVVMASWCDLSNVAVVGLPFAGYDPGKFTSSLVRSARVGQASTLLFLADNDAHGAGEKSMRSCRHHCTGYWQRKDAKRLPLHRFTGCKDFREAIASAGRVEHTLFSSYEEVIRWLQSKSLISGPI